MLNSSSLANLQMLMNTGDGRQAVLSEFISTAGKKLRERSAPRNLFSRSLESQPQNIHRRQVKHIRLLQPTFKNTETTTTLTESIVAVLDKLSHDQKTPLIAFAENLSYHYNNLFMGLIGHISIVMHHITPSHPAYAKLRECEERILNTAMIIRLLVDVFRRNEKKNETLYPIDLSNKEIGQKIFSNDELATTINRCRDAEHQVHRIQLIVSDSIACALKRTLADLCRSIMYAFGFPGMKSTFKNHYHRSMACIKKGTQISNALLEYAGRIHLKRSKLDLSLLLREVLAHYQSDSPRAKASLKGARGPVTVCADHSFLRRALLELVDLFYRKEPSSATLHITLKPARRAESKTDSRNKTDFHQVTICHSVNKDAMPACTLPVNLFDSQAKANRKDILALAAATGIIRKHGGKLLIQKSPSSSACIILLPS